MNVNGDDSFNEKQESEEYEDYFGFINNNDDEDRTTSKSIFVHDKHSLFVDKKSILNRMEESYVEHEDPFVYKNSIADNEPPFKKYKVDDQNDNDFDRKIVSSSLGNETYKCLEDNFLEVLEVKDSKTETDDKHSSNENDKGISVISPQNSSRLDKKLLWNKREYCYRIDRSWGDRIWDAFVGKRERKNVIEKDLSEDAFYSGYSVVHSYDISFFRENKYLLTRLSCQNLRKLNMRFLKYNRENIIEMEEYISLYRRCNEDKQKLILKNIIIQKRKLIVLYNKIRNYMSEIILLGEDCHNFLEKAYHTVFKKSLPLDLLSTVNIDDVS